MLINHYASLIGMSLRRYGYQVGPSVDIFNKNRDKYHENILNVCKKHINDVLTNEKYKQMVMKKEYEYTMNVLEFHLQTLDVMPTFPCTILCHGA